MSDVDEQDFDETTQQASLATWESLNSLPGVKGKNFADVKQD